MGGQVAVPRRLDLICRGDVGLLGCDRYESQRIFGLMGSRV